MQLIMLSLCIFVALSNHCIFTMDHFYCHTYEEGKSITNKREICADVDQKTMAEGLAACLLQVAAIDEEPDFYGSCAPKNQCQCKDLKSCLYPENGLSNIKFIMNTCRVTVISAEGYSEVSSKCCCDGSGCNVPDHASKNLHLVTFSGGAPIKQPVAPLPQQQVSEKNDTIIACYASLSNDTKQEKKPCERKDETISMDLGQRVCWRRAILLPDNSMEFHSGCLTTNIDDSCSYAMNKCKITSHLVGTSYVVERQCCCNDKNNCNEFDEMDKNLQQFIIKLPTDGSKLKVTSADVSNTTTSSTSDLLITSVEETDDDAASVPLVSLLSVICGLLVCQFLHF